MKTVKESFKRPSLAGFFVTICGVKVLFHGAPKKILIKKNIKVVGRSPNLKDPVEKISPPYMASPPLGISNIE
jgi:hypothetical protein